MSEPCPNCGNFTSEVTKVKLKKVKDANNKTLQPESEGTYTLCLECGTLQTVFIDDKSI